MTTPVKFLLTTEVAQCHHSECLNPKNKVSVFHQRGSTHPMHLECALKMISSEEKCSFCQRSVDGDSLDKLKNQKTEILSDSSERSPMQVVVAEGPPPSDDEFSDQEWEAHTPQTDRELALKYQNLEAERAKQIRQDAALAERLQKQSNSGEPDIRATTDQSRGCPNQAIIAAACVVVVAAVLFASL